MKKALGLVSAAALIGAGLISATPAQAATLQITPAARCTVTSYIPKYKPGTWTVTYNVLAQLKDYSLPPSGKVTMTKTVTTLSKYRAGATISGSIDAKVGIPFLDQAEVKFGGNLSGSGAWSTENKTTVSATIANTSKHNATFVFFRGSSKKIVTPVLRSSCDGGGSTVGTVVWRRVGTYRTFTVPTEGAARCGAGTANVDSVTKKALAVGCA